MTSTVFNERVTDFGRRPPLGKVVSYSFHYLNNGFNDSPWDIVLMADLQVRYFFVPEPSTILVFLSLINRIGKFSSTLYLYWDRINRNHSFWIYLNLEINNCAPI